MKKCRLCKTYNENACHRCIKCDGGLFIQERTVQRTAAPRDLARTTGSVQSWRTGGFVVDAFYGLIKR